jgi:hypothetical protein
MLGTLVPIAPIDENGQTLRWKDDIHAHLLPRQREGMIPAKSITATVKLGTQK